MERKSRDAEDDQKIYLQKVQFKGNMYSSYVILILVPPKEVYKSRPDRSNNVQLVDNVQNC